VALYGADSSILLADPQNCLLDSMGRATVKGKTPILLEGIMLDPPAKFVTDVAQMSQQYIEKNQPIMIIYLDGFGYDSYQEAEDKGLIPFMSSLKSEKAATVYPSITPVAFAAMVSGQAPNITGIKSRNDHLLYCSTIFDIALSKGLKTFIAEGDI
jgi:hypothetical protein